MGRGKPPRGGAMEGRIARWYARNMQRSQLDHYRSAADEVGAQAPAGAAVLEIAAGPGFTAIELARRGLAVTGLDISRTFVGIATEKAGNAGVQAEFVRGDAAALPFPGERFDFVVCWSAFKNFADPQGVLGEVHRVLQAGGTALIDDLRRDAPDAEIAGTVRRMRLGRFDAWMTLWIFRHQLVPRAYTRVEVEGMLARSPFERWEVREKAIELAAWMWKT